MNAEVNRVSSGAAFLQSLKGKPYFALIERKYAGKVARRSGVSYINHIREGALILYSLYGNEEDTIGAYCLHPLFQGDDYLVELVAEPESVDGIAPRILLLGMEYRRVANGYTIKSPLREPADIDIGPLE